MSKRITALLLVIIISIMISSCTPESFRTWKSYQDEYPDLYIKVKVVSDDEDSYHLEYNGQRYNWDKFELFELPVTGNLTFDPIDECITEGDVLISWGCLPFGIISYLDRYYSDTADNPVFIYNPRLYELYIREDYNYETDTFVIEGTEQSFVFSDMLTPSYTECTCSFGNHPDSTIITMYSKAYPRLRIKLRVFCENDTWIAHNPHYDSPIFEVSDEFIKILSDNGKLNVDNIVTQ